MEPALRGMEANAMRGTRPGATTQQGSAPGPSYVTAAVVALVMLILSPMALIVTGLCWGSWTVWSRVRAWMLGIAAAGAVLLMTVTTSGPLDLASRSGRAWLLLYQAAGDGVWSVAGAIPRALVLWLPAGLPIGLAVGGLLVGWLEWRLRRQPWHPKERERQDQARVKELRQATRRAGSADVRRQGDALAVTIGQGDLSRDRWAVRRGLLVPSPYVLARPQAVVAVPGAGKTEILVRKARGDAAAGRQCFFLDCKGTDPELVERFIAAYLEERPDARVAVWPAQPYDAWRYVNDPQELVDRFMKVESFSREGGAGFYTGQTQGLLQLAMTAPAGPPRTSQELLRRIDKDVLKKAWQGERDQEIDQYDDRSFQGARTRYATFFRSLRGQFDGAWAFEDVDLAVLTIPTLADKQDGDAAFRLFLADALNYASGRKDRSRPASFIVDEFSAVYGGRSMAFDLAERGRDPGLAVTLTAQSTEGIGDDQAVMRMLQACVGGVVLMRNANPEPIIRLAGTRPGVDYSYRLDDWGTPSPVGTVRNTDRPAIDANDVRRARPGEAWILEGGGVQHVQVIREQSTPEAHGRAVMVAAQAEQEAHRWGVTSVYWGQVRHHAEIAAQTARKLPTSRRWSLRGHNRTSLPPIPSNDEVRMLPRPPEPELELRTLRELPRVALLLLRRFVRSKVSGRWGRSAR